MNIGVYVESITDEDIIGYAIESIEIGFNTNQIDDATIFYDSVGFTPFFFPCGLFNSTELWNFSGTLVTFSLNSLKSALSIVNNIDIYYCYGWEDKTNVLSLLDTLSKHPDIKLISKNDEFAKNLFRITGKKSKSIDNNSLLKILGD
jgi:hypothetical protein